MILEEYYYPIPPTKTQKAIICLPEEVQAWKDENQELKTQITKLKAALTDSRAEYLLILDTNPNIVAWNFDELSRKDQDSYRKDAQKSFKFEESIMAIQLSEAETQIVTLKKIALEERSAVLTADICNCGNGCGDISMSARAAIAGNPTRVDDYEGREERLAMARRQLAKEHPEIDWDQ